MFVHILAIAQTDSLNFSDGIIIDEITIQSDSIITLKQIDQTNLKLESIPTLTQLTEVLRSHNNIYVKSYGLGSSSTISVRGGSSNQTSIQWEGLTINNPMLGVTDLSLIPTSYFSDMTINKGGASASSGSGAISGVIQLSNSIDYATPNKLKLDLSHGSFGSYNSQVQLIKKAGRFSTKIDVQYISATNDFKYQIGNNPIEKITSNAQFRNKGFLATSQYLLNGSNSLKFSGWIQKTNRQIPALTTTPSWNISTTIYHRKINYSTELNYIQNKWLFNYEHNYTHTQGRTAFYNEGRQSLGQLNLFGSISRRVRNYRIKLDLHNQWSSQQNSGIIPAISISSNNRQLNFIAKFSREYRIPTLNELYWNPGGNLDLSTENGWSQELTLQYERTPSWNISTTIYHRKINDWILWFPKEGAFYWTAENLAEVRSYGIDSNLETNWRIGKLNTQINANYTYVISQNLKTIKIPVINAGDQLIYTPKHLGTITIQSEYKAALLEISTLLQSSASGINENLDGYNLTNLSLGYKLRLKNIDQQFSLSIKNLFNTNYRIIERRPMPGRSFQAIWSITI